MSKAATSLLRRVWLGAAILAASAMPGVAASYVVEGKTVRILDGDTIEILDAKNVTHRIRLEGIDAPEKAQPHGQDSKAALSKMVFGKTVTVKVSKREKWGRELGDVYLGTVDVNGSMIRYGHAMIYTAYKHRKELEDYEVEAREIGRGIWSDESKPPIPPWLWRKGSRP